MSLKSVQPFLVFSLAVLSVGFVVGCSAGNEKPQSIATPERVNQIVEMRKLFDKAQGDWNKLSADEQAQYNKMAGDAQQAQFMWNRMKNPGSMGGPPAGAPPTGR